MKEKLLNATIRVEKNKKGFYSLYLNFEDLQNVNIKVNDFGGTQKKTAQKLTYVIAKKLGA